MISRPSIMKSKWEMTEDSTALLLETGRSHDMKGEAPKDVTAATQPGRPHQPITAKCAQLCSLSSFIIYLSRLPIPYHHILSIDISKLLYWGRHI